MQKKILSTFSDSQGPSPDQLTDSTFPRLPFNKSLGPSPYPLSCETSQHFYTDSVAATQVPMLPYRNYQAYHLTRRKLSITGRRDSETPRNHFLYHPEQIRISPRAKIKIFTRTPKEEDLSLAKQRKNLELKLRKIGKKSKALPNLSLKTELVSVDFSPSWTMGEKLCKLTELSPLAKF